MKGRVADGGAAAPQAQPRSLRRRLFWFVVCAALGLAIGLAGSQLTGDPAWLIAIPVVLAVGWFVFADPTACAAAQRQGRGGGPTG